MICFKLIPALLFSLYSFFLHAQGVGLQKRSNPAKVRLLDSGIEYRFRTNDNMYRSTIAGFTDSSLTVIIKVNTETDSSQGIFLNKGDTSYKPVFRIENKELLFAEIDEIRRDRFKKQGWLAVPSMFLFGAMLGLIGLPFAAVINQGESFDEWAQVEAGLLVLSVPPILIGSGSVKYDTKRKWIIKDMDSR